jgi:exodeoxyribonuclease V alpha subunit
MQQSLFQGKDGFVQFLIEKYAIEFERTYKFKLTDEQLMAIELALTNRCAVISGYGGTGKTTVQRAIADIAQSMNRTLYIMALSGKAKERAAQATGREAMTIHGFIKAVREGSEKIDIYSDPLIIIDEASMVDIALLNKLLSLFDDLPFSLLTVGDTAQLSPVGFGLAWHKMAKSNNLPAVHLTKVHRQATHSPIHKAAMDIREGISHQLPEWKGEAEGIYLVNSEATDLLGNLYKLKKALPQAQILTPHMSHRMHDSGHKINKYLQRQLQLSDGGSRGVILGGTKIFIGDPVIVTENNYELNLFNGMTGQLKSVAMDALGKQCGYFEFEGRDDQIELTVDQMFDVGLSLAYGITMHKAQGSEYEVAIVCCIVKSPLLERSLLYTSVTRAKKLMIIVGSKKLYDAALKSLPRAETLCTGICL